MRITLMGVLVVVGTAVLVVILLDRVKRDLERKKGKSDGQPNNNDS